MVYFLCKIFAELYTMKEIESTGQFIIAKMLINYIPHMKIELGHHKNVSVVTEDTSKITNNNK